MKHSPQDVQDFCQTHNVGTADARKMLTSIVVLSRLRECRELVVNGDNHDAIFSLMGAVDAMASEVLVELPATFKWPEKQADVPPADTPSPSPPEEPPVEAETPPATTAPANPPASKPKPASKKKVAAKKPPVSKPKPAAGSTDEENW